MSQYARPTSMGEQAFAPTANCNKRGEPKMTPRLASLVKWVSELHDSGLQAHHCAEEFTLRWIHPLSHREKLACECPWLAHPSCEPAAGRIFNFAFSC
jgi:hypothetical protein